MIHVQYIPDQFIKKTSNFTGLGGKEGFIEKLQTRVNKFYWYKEDFSIIFALPKVDKGALCI